MFKISNGSIRLFRFAGIDVYLHWLWLVVAYFEVNQPFGMYTAPIWGIVEYVSIFGIVLLHEFGHVLACRQVGGTANRIMLWPLGGIAYVSPPPRPGAVLWSIAAGPLVNVLLVPVTVGIVLFGYSQGWNQPPSDVYRYAQTIAWINVVLLVFNLLPIYPLDGGQIVQTLLWFIIGRAKSLLIVGVLGLVSGVGIIALAARFQNWWLVILALF